jgi:membrane associated rhomboid family serine protease
MFGQSTGEAYDVQDRVSRPLSEAVGIVTPSLIVINVLIFAVMVFVGISPTSASPKELVAWGADFGPLTFSGQWWRIFTSCFLHFSVVHIAMNMFILFMAGRFTERLFGHFRFLAVYLLAGLGGSLASLVYHPYAVSAGASGAIFGIYGALLGLLLIKRRHFAKGSLTPVVRSAIFFLLYNLVYGLSDEHTDMSAHLGGLVTGFFLGLLLAWNLNGSGVRMPRVWTASVVVGSLFVAAVSFHLLALQERPRSDWYMQIVLSPSLPVGTKGRIFYNGLATKADAEGLVIGLNGLGLAESNGIVVLFNKSASLTTLSIPLGANEASYKTVHSKTSEIVNGKIVILPYDIPGRPFPWDDPSVLASFHSIGQQLQPFVGASPMQIVLLNNQGEKRKVLQITQP